MSNAEAEVKQPIIEEAYGALECIVGPKYVSINPAQCQAYCARGCLHEAFWWSNISRRPAGVILPETTEQVARIIKVCNRYGIPYLPGSTFGWLPTSGCNLRDDYLAIDLKRMNSLEIDEKNMYALVGPGVIYAQLQAEANKRDMYIMISEAGGEASVIANSLSLGTGHFAYRLEPSPVRRMNGMEWVTPDAEIVRIGSLVNGDDSGYWGDGVGPGLRGLLKGSSLWAGSMGIVTKMTIKLYPFQPGRFEPVGIGPHSVVVLPDRISRYRISCPSEEALRKVVREMSNAQIGIYVDRVPFYWYLVATARGNREFRAQFWEKWNKVTPEDIAKSHELRVMLVGFTSQKQLEYEERVLRDIVTECGGQLSPGRRTEESIFQYANATDIWLMSGSWLLATAIRESLRCCYKTGEEYMKRWTEEFVADAMDEKREYCWIMPFDMGRLSYSEFHMYHDPRTIDPERPEFDQGKLVRALQVIESVLPSIEAKVGAQCIQEVVAGCSYIQPTTRHNNQIWTDRFQKEFNAKGLSNPTIVYLGDALAQAIPPIITDEVRETVKEVQAAKWRGL